MPGRRFRIFSREFKEAAVRRILAGERIRAIASELRLRPQLLYTWHDHYEQGGPDALDRVCDERSETCRRLWSD